ncbi:hypothetical protein BDC45DRAFT_528821, partial [Circinella umbellata]
SIFSNFLNNLHLSTKIEKVDFERALQSTTFQLHRTIHPTLVFANFVSKTFAVLKKQEIKLYQYITNNFTSIQEIQINRT